MEIVFVHAGSAQLPEHLIDNLLFLKKTTHKTPIKVLSQADYECLLPEDIRSDKRFTFVPIETLQEGSESLAFKERSMMPKDIMNGFWFHTSYRFFLILDYMRQYGATNVLHLESDVVLLIDPTELEAAFLAFAEFAVTMDRIRAIPGIVWFKSALAAEALAQFMNSNTSVTDMESLGRFVEQFYGFAKPLPTIPRDYAERKGLPLNRYCDGIEQFGGIFDAAAIGQYLRGVHQINVQGNTRFFQNESSDLILSDYDLAYKKYFDRLRITLKEKVSGKPVSLLAIHFHSKHLKHLLSRTINDNLRRASDFYVNASFIKDREIFVESAGLAIKTTSRVIVVKKSSDYLEIIKHRKSLRPGEAWTVVVDSDNVVWLCDYVLPAIGLPSRLIIINEVSIEGRIALLTRFGWLRDVWQSSDPIVRNLGTNERLIVLSNPDYATVDNIINHSHRERRSPCATNRSLDPQYKQSCLFYVEQNKYTLSELPTQELAKIFLEYSYVYIGVRDQNFHTLCAFAKLCYATVLMPSNLVDQEALTNGIIPISELNDIESGVNKAVILSF